MRAVRGGKNPAGKKNVRAKRHLDSRTHRYTKCARCFCPRFLLRVTAIWLLHQMPLELRQLPRVDAHNTCAHMCMEEHHIKQPQNGRQHHRFQVRRPLPANNRKPAEGMKYDILPGSHARIWPAAISRLLAEFCFVCKTTPVREREESSRIFVFWDPPTVREETQFFRYF